MGGKSIRSSFEVAAKELGLVGGIETGEAASELTGVGEEGPPKWFQKIFARKRDGTVG
jgi:hypothetical protein